jgi:hypothetical protein
MRFPKMIILDINLNEYNLKIKSQMKIADLNKISYISTRIDIDNIMIDYLYKLFIKMPYLVRYNLDFSR